MSGATRQARTPAVSGIEKALAVVIAAMLVLAAAGTLAAFAIGSPKAAAVRRAAAARGRAAETRTGAAVFEGIGTVRTETRDDRPALVFATVAFSYDDADPAAREELDDKAARLRDAATAYFGSKSKDELGAAFEGVVKAELRERLDALLSIATVGELWLPDFAVVD